MAQSSFYAGEITTPDTPAAAPSSFYHQVLAGSDYVVSFNERVGEVTLLAADLTALSLTSAELAGIISNETGSGALVFATSPTLVTPILGVATGTSLNLSGALHVSGAITGSGTGHLFSSTIAFTPQIANWNAASDGTGAYFILRKSRSAGGAAVQVSDILGSLLWQASDASGVARSAASIHVYTSAVGASSVSGSLAFNVGDGSGGAALLIDGITSQVAVTATTPSISTATGALVVAGGVGVAGASYVGGNSYFGGDVSIGSNSFGTYPFYVYRDANGTRTIAVQNANAGTGARSGARFLNDSSQYVEFMMHSSTYTGVASVGQLGTSSTSVPLWFNTGGTVRLQIAGTGAVTFGTTAPVTVSSTTASTLPTNGALIVAGGAGVAGAVCTNNIAIPAGGTAGAGVMVSTTANFGVFFGSGAPSLSAAKGSIYLRSDGSGTTDRAYINTNGATTWTALTTVA
jgi:hypothetical protein